MDFDASETNFPSISTSASETSLFGVPIEILGFITFYLDGHGIGKLVFVGDKRLLSRLERGGVDSFRLTVHAPSARSLQWPHMISRFHSLRKLSIEFPKAAKNVYMRDLDLDSIPKSVISLSLGQASEALCSLILRKKRHLSILLPNLKHLTITDSYWMPNPGAIAKILPPTLISLSSCFQWESPEVDMLPNSLTNLELTIKSAFGSSKPWKANFPPNLEKLVLRRASSVQMVSDLVNLKSLTHLEVSWDIALQETSLDELVIPAHLHVLHVSCPLDAPKDFFYKLPTSLTVLEVNQNSPWSISENYKFPPYLDVLALRSSVEGRYEGSKPEDILQFVVSLPRTLKRLDFDLGLLELPFEAIGYLPPNLNHFESFLVGSEFNMEDYPPKLQAFKSQNGPSISQLQWLARMPNLDPSKMDIASSSTLPSFIPPMSLTSLHLSGEATKTGFADLDQAMAYLKPITTLRTVMGLNLNRLVFMEDDTRVARMAYFLPSSLTTLGLVYASNTPLMFDFGVEINAFPSLTDLHIRAKGWDRISFVNSPFPRSLLSVHLYRVLLSLEYIQDKYLPSLRTLVVDEISHKLNNESVKLLPRSLTFINIHGPNTALQLKDLLFLPESTVYLELPGTPELQKADPSKLAQPLSYLPPFLSFIKFTNRGTKSGPNAWSTLVHAKREAARQFIHHR